MTVVVEPLPRWARAFFGLIGVGLVAGLTYWVLLGSGRIGEAKPAHWRVDPGAELDEATRSIPIIVNERECASGRSASGRISTSVEYAAKAVHIDVGVRPLGGDQECPSNPDTEHTVKLTEPLGDREVAGESWP
jgi:hypothetical protein